MSPAMRGRVWTSEEKARLGELVAAGTDDAAIASELGRSLDAVKVKRQRLFPSPADPEQNLGYGKGRPGKGRYWTFDRTLEGLKDFAARNRGRLPSSDHAYSQAKKGHLEWPTATRVLEYFGTMADAWAAAGAARSRYDRGWVPWTQEDDDLLLEFAGEMTLKQIGRRIGRSWGACKRRLYDLGAGRARDVSGHLSAMQVAVLYNCPLARVKKLIQTGDLPARRVNGGHYWRIDPEDAERIKDKLSAPKRHSYQGTPPDAGDYDRRYGLMRVRRGGRVVRVPARRGAA